MREFDLCTAYLARLGLDPEPPSAAALGRLHRAHVERVPWETLWIQCGDAWNTDPTESARRITTSGRGGYCFHLNGGFSWLLDDLGYDVRRHVGGVHGPDGPTEAEMTNHLVLTVHGLPAAGNDVGTWYVDVGLGDALHDPLPLRAGEHAVGPLAVVLERLSTGGEWHLRHHARGAFTGMAWRDATTTMDAFDDRHEWLSTAPESRFVKYLCLQRRDALGADLLRGLHLERVGEPARPSHTLTSETDLFDALAEVFGIDVEAIPAATRHRVWSRAATAHRAWVGGTA